MKQLFKIGDTVTIKSKNISATIVNDKSLDILDGSEYFVGKYECDYSEDGVEDSGWFGQDELTK